jgi:hypothetical protein
MNERFENGDVALEVRTDEDFIEYVLEVGPAYVLLRREEWANLRELLEAYWTEVDDAG